MQMIDLIQKKKAGEALLPAEIEWFVKGVTEGTVPDYQVSAFCMAVLFQGMNDKEISALTTAMAASGDTIDLSEFGALSVDKHSTGGVGDKTTLILAPIVAACGGVVAKMSGRGLGHTGGTVDKLEAVPGYCTEMSREAFLAQCRSIGVAVIGQTGDLAPADKKLYALRDVTGTVDSVPLIVSSIMSKKLAAGAHSIVLDVTVGSGAFMKDIDSARILARKMVEIGKAAGRNVTALITNMDEPLGCAVGNAIEVREAIGVLKGDIEGELKEICLALAGEMVSMALGLSPEEGAARAREALESGAALAKFREWISAQGGDPRVTEDSKLLPLAPVEAIVPAPRSGYITHMDAEKIGNAAALLGAGRMTKDDKIDFGAGLVIGPKTGESVQKGEPLAILYTSDPNKVQPAWEKYLDALSWGKEAPEKLPLIQDILR